jgi:hypothetical protein
MTSESARRLVDGFEAAWRELRAATERLGPGGLEEATPSGWTAKEMLSHIAFWDEAVVAYVPMAFRVQPLPQGWRFSSGYAPGESWPAAGVHNAREAAWARNRTPDEVVARCDAAHAACAALLATVTDEEAREQADYFRHHLRHYAEHLAELEALLAVRARQEAPQ